MFGKSFFALSEQEITGEQVKGALAVTFEPLRLDKTLLDTC